MRCLSAAFTSTPRPASFHVTAIRFTQGPLFLFNQPMMDRHVGFATMNNAARISAREFPCMCKFISRMHAPKIEEAEQKGVHISKPWLWPPLRQFPGLGHICNDCMSSQTLILAYLIQERMKKRHDLETDRGGAPTRGQVKVSVLGKQEQSMHGAGYLRPRGRKERIIP